MVEIAAVFYAERPFHTAGRFIADIGNDAATQRTVRDKDILIVRSQQDRMEDLYFPYGSSYALRLDIIAYFIRLKK